MPYKFTFEPRNRIAGVGPATGEAETAAAAWKEVDGLMRSDEKVTEILDPNGLVIDWQELKRRAERERG